MSMRRIAPGSSGQRDIRMSERCSHTFMGFVTRRYGHKFKFFN